MKTKQVIVVPYDELWANNFIAIKKEIALALGTLQLGIEHVGSTSVKGLASKPIIDIDVIISDYTVFDQVVNALAKIGYYYEGNLGIEGREAFKYEGKEHLQQHHLYVCPKDSKELARHIKFRDYLKENSQAVKEYSNIKLEAAKLFPNDIDSYINYKSMFIQKIYAILGC